MSHRIFEYGILIQNALVRDLQQKAQSQRTALLGSIVKIEGVLGNRTFAIRFLKDDHETWESEKYCCDQEKVVSVAENFWPHLVAINSPQERVKLAKNPVRCEQLMQISVGSIVGYLNYDEVLLGTVKYIGKVIGRGKCYGIRLHERRSGSNCNGLSAGIQYFECPAGYGIFTTMENIIPQNIPSVTAKAQKLASLTHLLNDLTEKKVAGMNSFSTNCERHRKTYDGTTTFKNEIHLPTNDKNGMTNFRTSLSLQNILEPVHSVSVNTNNDFDQNTMVQHDSTHLINDKSEKRLDKHNSEIDLIDAIGGVWSGTTTDEQLEHFSNNLSKLSERKAIASANDSNFKSTRSKSINPVSHLMNGSKTVPRKVKLLQETKELDKNGTTKKVVEATENKLNQNYTEPKPPVASKLVHYDSPTPGTTNDLTIGTLVEISNDVTNDPLYGVIRWMGVHPKSKQVLVGIELEEEQGHLPLPLCDGVHNNQRFFKCGENRGIFVPLSQCHKDSRFIDEIPTTSAQHVSDKMFGKEIDCPIVKGIVAPLCMPTEEDVEAVCGKFRGIQGHHNSCYLDATLFAMFTFTGVFDGVLFRPKGPGDIPYYEEVQQVLREEIVNPLRTNLFVRADRVMNLRKLLDQLSSVSGLTSEEKDPEEFLNSLLAQILKAEPFLKLSSGHEAYHYQLFVEKDDGLSLPSVQQLFEQSFLTSDIKLKEVPSCLIIQMPRFGKNYKMYPRILPSQLLDVTDIIENSPRQCTVCGKLALWECKQCFGECGVGLESIAFCNQCIEKAHSHSRRISHSPKKLFVSQDFSIMAEHCHPPRLFMELFAVICIETSHYVAFVKCGVGHEAPWCFFDSMADRKGEQNGYNIPEMVACPDVSKWLSDEQMCRLLHEDAPSDRYLPEHARRLLCDAYICMYQSPDVMMYR